MNTEQQVISLETAKRLKELGFDQESYFYWSIDRNAENSGNPLYYVIRDSKGDVSTYFSNLYDKIFAYTVSELSAFMPNIIEGFHLTIVKVSEDEWGTDYKDWIEGGSFNFVNSCSENMAESMGKMLIWLIEKGHVKV